MRTLSTRSEDINTGYSTLDAYHWVCLDCFADFRDLFEWDVVECED